MKKNRFQTGIGFEFNNEIFTNKNKKGNSISQDKTPNKVSIINNNINYINNSIIDYQKRIKTGKNQSLGNILKPRKRKGNLLSKINFNIQKTNQNLNNPDEFYSNYFNSLLGGKINSKSGW